MAERSHQPTPKKLRESRQRGEVAKSRELTSLGLFVAVLLFIWFGAGFVGEKLSAIVELAIRAPQALKLAPQEHWFVPVQGMLQAALWVLAPMFGLGLIVALLIGALQTRGLFSLQAISPKFERIDPGRGLVNLFSTRQLFELGKMLLKTTLLMAVLGLGLAVWLDGIVKMVYAPAADLLPVSGRVVLALMGWAALVYALGAGLDYAHQFHEFMKQQKMTTDELRRESRELEGDPHIKASRRATAREIAMSDMVDRAAKASVVIVNPTHVSVALYFAPGKTDLPRVVAKGVDAVALRIRREAERSGVPVFEDRLLARQVFREVGLDQYITEDLIDGVAAVFQWVKLAEQRAAAGPRR